MNMESRHSRLTTLAFVAGAILCAPLLFAQGGEATPAEDNYLGWDGAGRLDLTYWGVGGDEAAFRQYHQQNDGANGGFDPGKFSFKREDGLTLWGEGHVDAPTDMGLHINLKKEGAGWAKLDLDQADYYYDGQFLGTEAYPVVGGLVPSSVRQDPGDLRSNAVDFALEVGLALDNFPKIWVGYERNVKRGKRSTWISSISEHANAPAAVEYGSQPEFFDADHTFNRVYAGIEVDLGASWSARLTPQYEIVDGTDDFSIAFFNETALDNRQFRRQVYDYDRFQSDFVVKGPLLKDKLALELGYHFDATWNRNNMESRAAGPVPYAEKPYNYLDNEHDSNAYMHRFFMELTWEACDSVTAWTGWQYRSGDQDNDSVRKDDGAPNMDEDFSGGDSADTNGPLQPDQTWFFDTKNRETGFAESLGVEVRCLPKTKVVVEGEFEQLDVDYDWNNRIVYADALAPLVDAGEEGDWSWEDTGSFNRYTVKLHVNSEFTDWMTSNLRYKFVFRDASHDEDVDIAEIKDDDPAFAGMTGDPTGNAWRRFYYPGTIEDTERRTHDVKWQLKFDVTSWLSVAPRAGFTYTSNDVLNQNTDRIAFTQSWLYGANVTIEPVEHLTLSTDAYVVDGFTFTRADRFSRSVRTDPISGGVGTNFVGAIYDPIDFDFTSISEMASYQVDKWTFNLYYGFTRQESWWRAYRHFGSLGAIYQISERFSIDATTGYEDYSEEQNFGVNDYDAWLGVLGFKGKF